MLCRYVSVYYRIAANLLDKIKNVIALKWQRIEKKNDVIMVQGYIKQKKYKQINSAAKCADCKYKVMISVEHGTLVQNYFLLMITFRIKAPS